MVPELHVVNEKLSGWPLQTPSKFTIKRPFPKGQKGGNNQTDECT